MEAAVSIVDGPTDTTENRPEVSIMQVQHRYVLFADIKGFSKIDDAELPELISSAWKEVARILQPCQDSIVTYNTWGDALFLVFSRPDVVDAVLKIRDWFSVHRTLKIRIACHFGDFFEYDDPFLGKTNAVGASINLTARIEPITRPNTIFVTRAFKSAFESASDVSKPGDIKFDPLGQIELAKKFGQEELFLLRRANDKPHILDRLAHMDLSRALPDVPGVTADQKAELEQLSALSGALLRAATNWAPDPEGANAVFGLRLAEMHKGRGNYDLAEQISQDLLGVTLDADGLKIKPLEHEPAFIKLRVNIATRQGRYEEAHNLIYGLYKSGARDTDTLTMLASCYKRRAFFDADGALLSRPRRALLERSRDLYLEAVRKDISDYYPVINAAYAWAFLGDDGLAIKLANYCQELLSESRDENWWSASSYAETEVVQRDYEEAGRLLLSAVDRHCPKAFEKDALLDQLKLLARVRPAAALKDLISMLSA